MKYTLVLALFFVSNALAVNTNLFGEYVGEARATRCAPGYSSVPLQILSSVGTNFYTHILLSDAGNVIADFSILTSRTGVARGTSPTGAKFVFIMNPRKGTYRGTWRIPRVCSGVVSGHKEDWTH